MHCIFVIKDCSQIFSPVSRVLAFIPPFSHSIQTEIRQGNVEEEFSLHGSLICLDECIIIVLVVLYSWLLIMRVMQNERRNQEVNENDDDDKEGTMKALDWREKKKGSDVYIFYPHLWWEVRRRTSHKKPNLWVTQTPFFSEWWLQNGDDDFKKVEAKSYSMQPFLLKAFFSKRKNTLIFFPLLHSNLNLHHEFDDDLRHKLCHEKGESKSILLRQSKHREGLITSRVASLVMCFFVLLLDSRDGRFNEKQCYF